MAGPADWAASPLKKKFVLLVTGTRDVDARIGKLGDVELLEKKIEKELSWRIWKNVTVFWALVCYSWQIFLNATVF